MKKFLGICLIVLLVVSVTAAYGSGKGFPKRNITAVVVWGAGGGTDTCNRIIHAEMSLRGHHEIETTVAIDIVHEQATQDECFGDRLLQHERSTGNLGRQLG